MSERKRLADKKATYDEREITGQPKEIVREGNPREEKIIDETEIRL